MSVIKIIQEQIQKIKGIKKFTSKLTNSLEINFNDILNKLNNDLSQIEFDTKETIEFDTKETEDSLKKQIATYRILINEKITPLFQIAIDLYKDLIEKHSNQELLNKSLEKNKNNLIESLEKNKNNLIELLKNAFGNKITIENDKIITNINNNISEEVDIINNNKESIFDFFIIPLNFEINKLKIIQELSNTIDQINKQYDIQTKISTNFNYSIQKNHNYIQEDSNSFNNFEKNIKNNLDAITKIINSEKYIIIDEIEYIIVDEIEYIIVDEIYDKTLTNIYNQINSYTEKIFNKIRDDIYEKLINNNTKYSNKIKSIQENLTENMKKIFNKNHSITINDLNYLDEEIDCLIKLTKDLNSKQELNGENFLLTRYSSQDKQII